MNTKFAISLALAAAVTASPVMAAQTAINGVGTQKCSVVLKHDWMAYGEFAWISGYMTFASELAPVASNGIQDILPGGTPTDLVRMVFKQCKHDPSVSLYQATSTIAARLLNVQNHGSTDSSDDGEHEPGQAF